MGRELSADEIDRVTAAIYAGRKIEAIKLYRTASGDDLAAAKQVVEGIEARLRAESPEKFSAVSRSAVGGIVFAVVALAMAVGLVAVVRPGMFGGANKPAPQDAKPVPAAPPAANAEDDLTGRWTMHMPAGFDHAVELVRVDATRYRLKSKNKLLLKGVYERRNDLLVMEHPDDPLEMGFEWRIGEGNNLVLVAQPEAAQYLGATLKRQVDAGHEKPVADAAGDKLPPKPAPKSAKAIRKPPKLVDSTVEEAAPYDGDLAGAWVLGLNNGKGGKLRLVRTDATHLRLEPNGSAFSGLYEVRGGRLVMEKPVDARFAEFEWSIRDGDHLRLIVQPAERLAGGQNYLGATLTRQGDAE